MEKPSTSDNFRYTLMVYIKGDTKTKGKPKDEILKKALDLFKNSDSLPTCAAFSGILNEISDKKAAFLDFDNWIKILEISEIPNEKLGK